MVSKVVPDTTAKTLQGFVEDHTEETAQVYTDDGRGYVGIDRAHESVNHSAGEYARDMAHTNGIESFWATLERGHKGTFHKFSRKHLQRYVDEFSGRHNTRNAEPLAGVAGLQLREQRDGGGGIDPLGIDQRAVGILWKFSRLSAA